MVHMYWLLFFCVFFSWVLAGWEEHHWNDLFCVNCDVKPWLSVSQSVLCYREVSHCSLPWQSTLVAECTMLLKLEPLNVVLGQQFDSAAMQQLSTAIKNRTHRNFRPTVSKTMMLVLFCKLQHELHCLVLCHFDINLLQWLTATTWTQLSSCNVGLHSPY